MRLLLASPVHNHRVPYGVLEVLEAHSELDGVTLVLDVDIIHQDVLRSLLEVVHLGLAEVEVGVHLFLQL